MMTVCAAAELRGREETEDAIVIAVDPGWMRTDMARGEAPSPTRRWTRRRAPRGSWR